MAEQIIPLGKVPNILTTLPDQFDEDELDVLTITRNDEPLMVILPYERFKKFEQLLIYLEGIEETWEIMQDEEMMESIRRGVQDIEDGNVILLEDLKKELGLE